MSAETEFTEDVTALYRLYDQAGNLLYAGITGHLRQRMAQHAAEKPWWPQVARKTVAWHENRDDAEKAEAEAIRDEHPVHNVTNPLAPRAANLSRGRHGKNRTPLLAWHPAADTGEWLRAEAAARGVTLSTILNGMLANYRRHIEHTEKEEKG